MYVPRPPSSPRGYVLALMYHITLCGRGRHTDDRCASFPHVPFSSYRRADLYQCTSQRKPLRLGTAFAPFPGHRPPVSRQGAQGLSQGPTRQLSSDGRVGSSNYHGATQQPPPSEIHSSSTFSNLHTALSGSRIRPLPTQPPRFPRRWLRYFPPGSGAGKCQGPW